MARYSISNVTTLSEVRFERSTSDRIFSLLKKRTSFTPIIIQLRLIGSIWFWARINDFNRHHLSPYKDSM